jgi:hypothetical protein
MTQRTTLAARGCSILVLFATIALTFFACSSEGDNTSDFCRVDTESNSLLLNFTSDYSTGELRWMALDSTNLSVGALDFWQDSKVSSGGGNIFVLGNIPGNLVCILPEKLCDKGAIKQNLLDAQAPYEAAVIGNKGYIALNDEDYVQVFDIGTCTPSGKINLPIFGANASSIKASGDTLFVVLQRLENFSATKPGLLVRIKASTETIIDTIQLKFYNPSSSVLSNGNLYVSSQKYNVDYSVDLEKSGVEVVNLVTKTSEVLATGIQLGGGVYGIALDETSQVLYAVVYEYWGSLPIKPITLSSKTIETALPGITDASGGLVFDNIEKKLFVGDNSGLKVYNPVTKTTTAIYEGANALPPYSLAIVRW